MRVNTKGVESLAVSLKAAVSRSSEVGCLLVNSIGCLVSGLCGHLEDGNLLYRSLVFFCLHTHNLCKEELASGLDNVGYSTLSVILYECGKVRVDTLELCLCVPFILFVSNL